MFRQIVFNTHSSGHGVNCQRALLNGVNKLSKLLMNKINTQKYSLGWESGACSKTWWYAMNGRDINIEYKYKKSPHFSS